MNCFLRRSAGCLAVAVAALAGAPAWAVTYTSLTIFGDSLSDTGNVFAATGGGVAGPPYDQGRFSDGPVWVDHLAAGLGLSAVPSVLGGNNYAWGGARTGTTTNPTPGLMVQYRNQWLPANANKPVPADPNGLFVVVGGGNDLRDARGASSTGASRQAGAAAAASNVGAIVAGLASLGARHVLISNVPDLGFTPEAASMGAQIVANSTDVTQRFNLLIAGLEPQLEMLFPDLEVSFLDMAGVAAAIRNDAQNNGGMLYGITNVTMPCGPFPGSMGADCSISAFSDALHPSAAAHRLIGDAALAALAPIPEPGTWLLMALGLGAVVLRRRSAVAG